LVSADVRRINEVLERLLEYGQFLEPRLVGNDLRVAVERVLREKGKELDGIGLEVVNEIGVGLPMVLFDGDQLGFVLRNVLGEAAGGFGGKRLRLATGLVEGESGRGVVELRVWYEGGEGVLRGLQRSVWPEGSLGFEDWGLALELVRKVMGRNRGEMRMNQEEAGATTIILHFSIAQ
jgi:nitrogen-specific signal transduction histidine kinase